MSELRLPAFEMDCRDWIVTSPEAAGLPADDADGPVLAVLSTVVIDSEIREATGALTVGLLDDDQLDVREVAPGATAQQLLDIDAEPGMKRFVMPTPNRRLAVLAEFVVGDGAGDELDRRVEALMTSFRWQAA